MLFFFLEGFCFYLIVQYNKKQNEIYVNSSNMVTGVLYRQYNDVVKFWKLSDEAAALAQQNAQLYNQLSSSKFNHNLFKDSISIRDSLNRIQQRYTYISAEVINNNVSGFNNYLTLNRGSIHGIYPGMGVISVKTGIVGIVKRVSPHFCQVMSLLHQQTKISAELKKDHSFGSLQWRGKGNPLYMSLEEVPKHAPVMKGDTIQTTGYSSVFPSGIMVGTVEDFRVPSGNNFYNIDVKLSCDLSNIKYVYIINHLMKREQDQLEAGGSQ